MKLASTTILSALLLILPATEACATYKRCWCENGDRQDKPNTQATYDLCAQQKGTWGNFGAKRPDGKTVLMQCKAPEDEGWDNCLWADACTKFSGATTGYCHHQT